MYLVVMSQFVCVCACVPHRNKVRIGRLRTRSMWADASQLHTAVYLYICLRYLSLFSVNRLIIRPVQIIQRLLLTTLLTVLLNYLCRSSFYYCSPFTHTFTFSLLSESLLKYIHCSVFLINFYSNYTRID